MYVRSLLSSLLFSAHSCLFGLFLLMCLLLLFACGEKRRKKKGKRKAKRKLHLAQAHPPSPSSACTPHTHCRLPPYIPTYLQGKALTRSRRGGGRQGETMVVTVERIYLPPFRGQWYSWVTQETYGEEGFSTSKWRQRHGCLILCSLMMSNLASMLGETVRRP